MPFESPGAYIDSQDTGWYGAAGHSSQGCSRSHLQQQRGIRSQGQALASFASPPSSFSGPHQRSRGYIAGITLKYLVQSLGILRGVHSRDIIWYTPQGKYLTQSRGIVSDSLPRKSIYTYLVQSLEREYLTDSLKTVSDANPWDSM